MGSTDSLLRNCNDFVEVIAGVRLSPDEQLVRLDVSSHLTKVPIQEAVDAGDCMMMKPSIKELLCSPAALQLCYNYVYSPPTFVSVAKSMTKGRGLQWVYLYQQR